MVKKIEGLSGTDMVCANLPGAFLREINRDGDYVNSIPVPVGQYRAAFFMTQIGRGHLLVPGEGVMAYPPAVKTVAIDFGAMHDETSASQTFRVEREDREKRRNDLLEQRLNAQERRLANQQRALDRARDQDPVSIAAREAAAKADAEAQATQAAKDEADKVAAKDKAVADAAAL